MKHYLKVSSTAYTLASLDRVSAMQALASKITGEHRPVKSRGAEKRSYPRYGAGMTTADYVRHYYALNSYRKNYITPPPYGDDNLKGFYDYRKNYITPPPYGDDNLKGFYDALSGRVSVPDGVDSVEICS